MVCYATHGTHLAIFFDGVLYNHMNVVHTSAYTKSIRNNHIIDSYWLCVILGFHRTDVKHSGALPCYSQY